MGRINDRFIGYDFDHLGRRYGTGWIPGVGESIQFGSIGYLVGYSEFLDYQCRVDVNPRMDWRC